MAVKDPAMLGGTNYPRTHLDFYPTPARVTEAYLKIVEDDLPAMQFWEPFAGNGAIYNLLKDVARNSAASDIHAYEGFDPNAFFDFFNIYTDEDVKAYQKALATWNETDPGERGPGPVSMSDVEAIFGFRPDCIISNPPYGKEAEKAVRKALKLMEPEKGYVAFLMRHEWDCAKTRRDLFDHPAFAAKITLRFRPIWVEKKAGEKSKSPRFSYAWYVWDFTKAAQTPFAKPELLYAN